MTLTAAACLFLDGGRSAEFSRRCEILGYEKSLDRQHRVLARHDVRGDAAADVNSWCSGLCSRHTAQWLSLEKQSRRNTKRKVGKAAWA